MSVFKIKSIWYYNFKLNGRRYSKSTGMTRKSDALMEEAKVRSLSWAAIRRSFNGSSVSASGRRSLSPPMPSSRSTGQNTGPRVSPNTSSGE